MGVRKLLKLQENYLIKKKKIEELKKYINEEKQVIYEKRKILANAKYEKAIIVEEEIKKEEMKLKDFDSEVNSENENLLKLQKQIKNITGI